jgi:hypothetical protein
VKSLRPLFNAETPAKTFIPQKSRKIDPFPNNIRQSIPATRLVTSLVGGDRELVANPTAPAIG